MNTEHGGMYDQAPVWANPNNFEENDYEEQVQLLAQAQAHRQELQNPRVRRLDEEDAARVRRFNEEAEAARARATRTRAQSTRDGNRCIVM